MPLVEVIESPAYPVDAFPRLQVIHEQISDSQGLDGPQDVEKVLPDIVPTIECALGLILYQHSAVAQSPSQEAAAVCT